MLALQKILVPVDLSAASTAAVPFAALLADRLDAWITLLHCGAADDETRARLEALARTEAGCGRASTAIAQGEPASVIVEYARAGRFDLIVMSTHGYGPFRRLLLGSVTSQVLDQADCPVFTGAHLEQAAAGHRMRFDTVLSAVDLGPNTENVARWAGDFAAAVHARLFLVHVVPDLGASEGDYFRADANLAPANQAFQELAALQDRLHLCAKAIVAGGAIPEALRIQACELGADMLVAGRGVRGGRLGRLRSNALEIIRSAPCAVITV